MRLRSGACAIAVLAMYALGPRPVGAGSATAQEALAQFAAAWTKVNSYTCTITAHEVDGSRVQDRVYAMSFEKPHNTRLNIVGGDGHGGAAVWTGGDTVTGHQGGILSMIKLNLNIHAHLATSLRGTTIADANWGALYDHISGLKSSSINAEGTDQTHSITVMVSDPSSDNDVTKEVIVLGKDQLPVEYDQYQGDQQVKHTTYSDVKLNVDLPASTWSM